MNYLAHSLACLDDPYEVAGAAVPDWLGLTRPRLRCRSRQAAPFAELSDPCVAAVARGVMRHHADDDWFHQTATFCDLSLEFARRVRHTTGDVDGMRPSFLGHILVELLLDATLMAENRWRVDAYYAALNQVDADAVAGAVGTMIGADASALASIIRRFRVMRFLYDYADDGGLVFRLNQVMRRVRLPELPERFTELLPAARAMVTKRRDELLAPGSPLWLVETRAEPEAKRCARLGGCLALPASLAS
jgi:hypothetical protein